MGKIIQPDTLSDIQAGGVSKLCLQCMQQDLKNEMTPKGRRTFSRFLDPERLIRRSKNQSTFFLVQQGPDCHGVLEITGEGHLLLFFVSPENRKMGIGRSLFEKCLKNFSLPITGFSTAMALPVYLILGFQMRGPAKTLDGITGYPVVYGNSG